MHCMSDRFVSKTETTCMNLWCWIGQKLIVLIVTRKAIAYFKTGLKNDQTCTLWTTFKFSTVYLQLKLQHTLSITGMLKTAHSLVYGIWLGWILKSGPGCSTTQLRILKSGILICKLLSYPWALPVWILVYTYCYDKGPEKWLDGVRIRKQIFISTCPIGESIYTMFGSSFLSNRQCRYNEMCYFVLHMCRGPCIYAYCKSLKNIRMMMKFWTATVCC